MIIPYDPYCGRYPHQIKEYIAAAKVNDTTPSAYVQREEGTFNPCNGHFLCTKCYIAAGMPTSPQGWKCP